MKPHLERFRRALRERGFKSTRQRDLIAAEFFRKHRHLTVEELLEKVRRQDASVGHATVYRTLKLLTEAGLAFKREFGDGRARFEHVTARHHDHMICLDCGEIAEFENEAMERLQEKICRGHRFRMLNHKMELYGQCRNCQKKGGGRAGH